MADQDSKPTLAPQALEELRLFAEAAKAAGPRMPQPIPRRRFGLEPRLGTPNTPSEPETSDD